MLALAAKLLTTSLHRHQGTPPPADGSQHQGIWVPAVCPALLHELPRSEHKRAPQDPHGSNPCKEAPHSQVTQQETGTEAVLVTFILCKQSWQGQPSQPVQPCLAPDSLEYTHAGRQWTPAFQPQARQQPNPPQPWKQ